MELSDRTLTISVIFEVPYIEARGDRRHLSGADKFFGKTRVQIWTALILVDFSRSSFIVVLVRLGVFPFFPRGW